MAAIVERRAARTAERSQELHRHAAETAAGLRQRPAALAAAMADRQVAIRAGPVAAILYRRVPLLLPAAGIHREDLAAGAASDAHRHGDGADGSGHQPANGPIARRAW